MDLLLSPGLELSSTRGHTSEVRGEHSKEMCEARFSTESGCLECVTRPGGGDLKLHLQSTDYGSFLSNETGPLTVSVIDERLKQKLLLEFVYLRNHALQPLTTFLDYITYSYMIDNVILLITGTLRQRPISELLPKCHPLGSFEQMEAVHIAQTPAELYNAILVDTPLASFFQDCISENDLDEVNIEILRNKLYKAYLESFYNFCKEQGGQTEQVMCPILEFEADRRAFIITLNSFGTELSRENRSALYPRCGRLHPDGLTLLSNAEDFEHVRAVAAYYAEYKYLFEHAGNDSDEKTLEDKFFEYESGTDHSSPVRHAAHTSQFNPSLIKGQLR